MEKSIKENKRNDYISWDDYFMSIAILASHRSKDPHTQVGSCIVNPNNKIVGIGYNGFPIGCSDDKFPWSKEGSFLDTKYAYVCHAEVNAILNSIGESLYGCVMYTALFPCNECAKIIIQSKLNKVVYLSDKYSTANSTHAAKYMFNQAGVIYEKLKPAQKKISIHLTSR